MSKQEQSSGDNSTNIQANSLTIHQGLTVAEARQIALDVYKSNLYEMAGIAANIARDRVEKITDAYLEKTIKVHPEGIQKANDPGFQFALRTVQKEYAKTGDDDLADILVDLLIDQTKHDARTLIQIVLTESLETAPKLTSQQLSALALVFYFKYTQNQIVGNLELLSHVLEVHIKPFVTDFAQSNASFQHLEFCGCGSVAIGGITLEKALLEHYRGIFLEGFDASEVTTREISIGLDPRFFIPCLNDGTKFQVKARNKKDLDAALRRHEINDEDSQKIRSLFDIGIMPENKVRDGVCNKVPYMAHVFDAWNKSPMKSFTLTSVGIAIAHANIKRHAGEFADLRIWIN